MCRSESFFQFKKVKNGELRKFNEQVHLFVQRIRIRPFSDVGVSDLWQDIQQRLNSIHHSDLIETLKS